jgi:uncharacterized coiled-coil DUF342 family protein
MATNNSNTKSTPSFKELQNKVEKYKRKRDELNRKTKEYINELQNVEEQINENLKLAREKYKKRRDYWNDKVARLKDKKIEYKKLLNDFYDEKRNLQRHSSGQNQKFRSMKEINRKMENLERIIETENLHIQDENEIVDKISTLAEEKKKLEQAQNSDKIFKKERQIEIVKINLNKIYEQLEKWSKRSQEYHNKMLETFDKVNELKDKKRKLEEKLIENKKRADDFHEKYISTVKKKNKLYKGRKPSYKHRRKRRRGRSPRSKKLEKIKQEKLAEAIEKQKAGKKLNLFEARLILEKEK